LCLSGTPVVNTPSELITQLKVINRLEKDFGGSPSFRANYNRTSAAGLAALNRKLRSTCYVRRRKIDVLTELPPALWADVVVEGDPKVMVKYREAEANIIRYLKEKARAAALAAGATTKEAAREAWLKEMRASAGEHLVRIAELKQIAARAKMQAANLWIKDFLDNDKKLIAFGWHREVVDEIAEKFSNGVKIQGGISATVKDAAVQAFQENDSQRVIACNIKAAGVGLTLTAASDVLFLEQGWSPSDMDQGIARAHRIGQQDSVTGWLMLVEDTIDMDIAELIAAKRRIVDAATDGTDNDDVEARSVGSDLVIRMTERAMAQEDS
jgi:SWI/SNF-related matrix-associated actin-dependent regulator 1 of chromatin subfamily A